MKYKFSVITAVYNTEKYLDECITSIINQTMDFKEIQFILVNDGSTDKSGEICEKYKRKYNNIIVLHKLNGGVSSARNLGLSKAQGKYISFVDSDDKIPANFFEKIFFYFEKHINQTDIVTVPIHFFDKQTGEHWQNEKFKKGTRIINLQNEYNVSLMFVTASIFKHSVIKNYLFDENVRTGEDLKLINTMLIKNQNLGVLCETNYFYRLRQNEDSLIQTSKNKIDWYEPYLDNVITYLYEYSIDTLGYFPYFLQYTLACDLQWKIKQQEDYKQALNNEALVAYKSKLWKVLSFFDDSIILNLPKLIREEKIFWLMKKYKREPNIRYQTNNGLFHFANTNCGWLSQGIVKYEFFKINNDEIYIKGHVTLLPFISDKKNLKIFIQCDNRRFPVTLLNKIENYSMLDNERIFVRRYFEARLLLPIFASVSKIECILSIENKYFVKKTNIEFGQFFPLNKDLTNSFYTKKGYSIYFNNNILYIQKLSKLELIKKELLYNVQLFNKSKKAFIIRQVSNFVKVVKKIYKKPIWLISDKADKADDNGEAFFKFMRSHKEIKTYFVVGKKSMDFIRLSEYGKVIDYLSYKHKLMYLFADKIISAYSHKEFSMPIFTIPNPIIDVANDKKNIFLQHGIIKDDMSLTLNKEWKNFDMFVTSTKAEFDSLSKYNYNYTNCEVVLTGLPRYDNLVDNRRNLITIAPTWRRYLFGDMDTKTNIWPLKDNFIKSEFYKFYDALLNNQELIDKANEFGFEIQFLPHPIFFPYIKNFHVNSKIKILSYGVKYNDIFAESALMLTDYSSAVFDFAYLYKPVIYAHFDEKNYNSGYFDYEKDGLGEICHDVDSTVQLLIDYMQNGCVLKEKYKKRIDKFFKFRDKNNCQRVYDCIIDLDKK